MDHQMTIDRWTTPLSLEDVADGVKNNSFYKHNVVELVPGFFFGPLIKVHDTHSDTKYYCGGHIRPNHPWAWKKEQAFFEAYPEMAPPRPIMTDPMFDLEDMELAEILIDEMKG